MPHNQNITTQQSQPQLSTRKRNQFLFGIALIVFEIMISMLYGFYASTPTQFINISSILITIFLVLLVIAGFGLYFSYLRNLLWTIIGNCILLVAISIQLFPLINSFWSKAAVFNNPKYQDSFGNKGLSLFLSNFDSTNSQGNTITQAIKCSLALVIGSSGIIGRSGPLQILILGIIGTITFQLNRQVAARIGLDHFGSFTIFGFGGFLSLGSGIMYLFRQNVHPIKTNLWGVQSSISNSIIGSLFIFLFAPILAFEGNNSMKAERFTSYTSSLSVILSMGAGIVTSVSMSLLVRGNVVRIRDVQNGLLAGMVVGGTASYYITNPALSICCGFFGAILQYFFQNYLQKYLYKRLGIFCTYPPAVFSFQSIVASIFTAFYCMRVTSITSDNFIYTQSAATPATIFAVCFCSAGIGFATGLILGIFSYCLNSNQSQKMFHDKYHWITSDRVSFKQYRDNKIQPPKIKDSPPTYSREIQESQSWIHDPNLWQNIA